MRMINAGVKAKCVGISIERALKDDFECPLHWKYEFRLELPAVGYMFFYAPEKGLYRTGLIYTLMIGES